MVKKIKKASTTSRAGGKARRPSAKAASKARRARPARKPPPAARAKKAPSPAGKAKAALRRPRLKKTQMSKKELAEFRQMLLEKRRTLVGDLSGMEQETLRKYSSGNLSSMPTHMADVGTDNFEHEFTLGLLESEQALLREIDEALERIVARTYGICLGTGEAIPKTRLRAKPWAKYTVEYTRLLEKGLARPPEIEEEQEGQPAPKPEDQEQE